MVMLNDTSDRGASPLVLVRSSRRLLVDCLSHHFTTAEPAFRVASNIPDVVDPSIPMVCLYDVGLRHYSGPEKENALAELRLAAPDARILIYSGHMSGADASEWILAGAHGYFSTLSTKAMLTAAVSLLAAGGVYLPAEVTRSLLLSAPETRPDD
jgi:DNA-binding NarL/FixJ family response regulator